MYFICGANNNCFENSYSIGGDTMILYDYELNKKYVYQKVSDEKICPLSSRYQVGRESLLQSDEALFSFSHPVCTHQKDEKGWVISNTENIGVGKNRKPFLIGTSQQAFGGDY